MLKTETATVAMSRRVLKAARRYFGDVGDLQVDFEHGQWWVTILETGAQYSVVDAEGPGSLDGFGFEQVSRGDE